MEIDCFAQVSNLNIKMEVKQCYGVSHRGPSLEANVIVNIKKHSMKSHFNHYSLDIIVIEDL